MFPEIAPPRQVLSTLRRELKREKRGMRRALSRALNRSMTTAREQGKNLIIDQLNVKTGPVRKSISIRRSTPSSLRAKLSMPRVKTNLIEFKGTRQTKKGVSAKPQKKRGRLFVSHAFFARMRNGKLLAVRRRLPESRESYGMDKKGRPRKYRLPLDTVDGPSVALEFKRQFPKLARRMDPVFKKVLEHELEWWSRN